MSEDKTPLVNPKSWSICVVLTLIFWVFMTTVLIPHVPPAGPGWTLFWAFFSATPIAGTFYMASMCFTAVLVYQSRIGPSK